MICFHTIILKPNKHKNHLFIAKNKLMNFGTFYFDSDNTLSYSGRWTSLGFKKYKDAEIIRSSGEELFTKEFLENYMNDLHINFTSSKELQHVQPWEGKAQIL